jgi:hypothetical protein
MAGYAGRDEDVGEDDKLKDEWARAQASGRAMDRKKMTATGAGMAVTFLISVPLVVALLAVGQFDDRMGIGIAIAGLAAGWFVRNRLWPRGQFSR